MKTLDVSVTGYGVKTDVYGENNSGHVVLSLIGRTSKRVKWHYQELLSGFAANHNATAIIFDYSGHGDSPFDINDVTPAQNFLEVISVFDWLKKNYPDRPVCVIGSSYGGYHAALLTQYRNFDQLILRAPAIYYQDDFYTSKAQEDKSRTMRLRNSPDILKQLSLMTSERIFKGRALVIAHKNDGVIPEATTNAYAESFSVTAITAQVKGHSLDDSLRQDVEDYYSQIESWLFNTAI